MRRTFSIFTVVGLVLLLSMLSFWNAALVNAQAPCGGRGQPPCPTPVPATQSHPNIPFLQSDPFRGPVPVQQPSATNTPTLPPPVINTATSTPTPTQSPTVPATVTRTNTPTATPTKTPFPSSIVLNELLPKAQGKDWNNDGSINAGDQWVEVYNTGSSTVDISSWKIDTGENTLAFTIPPSTTIASKGFLVFYSKQTKLAWDAATQARLLYPDGRLVDGIQYTLLEPDRVHARSVDGSGVWRVGCVPSPNTPNCVAIETTTSSFDMPYFKDNIASPNKGLEASVVVTNVLLAIILALAMGFFSNLLNDAIESHEAHVARLFSPITSTVRMARRLGSGFDEFMSRARLAWLGFALKLVLILLVYGAILAFLDPGFTFVTPDGFMLIVALGLSTGLVGLIDDMATLFYLRSKGAAGSIRMHSGNLLIVIASTLFSRLTGLVPGLIVGSPAGIEDVPDEHAGVHLDVLGIAATGAVGFIAWLLAPVFSNDAWFNTLFLLIFAAGVQTVFFEMIPISYLHGKGIFQYHRGLWLLIFAVATAFFLQTMLNPDGAFVNAFNSPNMVLLSLIVIAYCLFCVAAWYNLNRLDQKTTPSA